MDKIFDQDSFLFAANGDFIEDLYLKYLENPDNIDENWMEFFANLSEDQKQTFNAIVGASWLPRKNKVILPPEVVPDI